MGETASIQPRRFGIDQDEQLQNRSRYDNEKDVRPVHGCEVSKGYTDCTWVSVSTPCSMAMHHYPELHHKKNTQTSKYMRMSLLPRHHFKIFATRSSSISSLLLLDALISFSSH